MAGADKQGQRGADCHDNADKMGDGAAGILDLQCMFFHEDSSFSTQIIQHVVLKTTCIYIYITTHIQIMQPIFCKKSVKNDL